MNKLKNDIKTRTPEELEQIKIDIIKLLLEKNVSLEDIQNLSGKSISEIKAIGELRFFVK